VRLLAAALALFLSFTTVPTRAGDIPVDLELVLTVDVSGSIDWEEAALQRRGYVDGLSSDEVIAAIRSGPHGRIALAYVEWAGAYLQRTIIDWMVIDGADSAKAFAARLSEAPIETGPWTSISSAIRYVVPMFAGNGYEGTRRVMDISGDGPNNAGPPIEDARRLAIESGITINGLPIVNERPGPGGMRNIRELDKYYGECVIGGPGAFMIVARSFADFGRAIKRKLVFEIAGRIPDESPRIVPVQGTPGGGNWFCGAGERQLRGGDGSLNRGRDF
jgi:hypothetical protein